MGSGGDYLHASLYTRILSRTAKENYSSSVYIDIGTGRIAFFSPKPCKSYSSRAYIHVRPVRIAFCSAKPSKKLLLYIDIGTGVIAFLSAKTAQKLLA